ncbi:MAG: ankyrin repeat domain-containing protein [Alphaproteobacteria bacterium]|nr:ankyrin repeat domain-containing protein [Alphaproteobacteria bacterium]
MKKSLLIAFIILFTTQAHASLQELIDGVKQNDKKAVLALLNNGEDVNAVNAQGNAPLHYAVALNNAEMAKILLQYGADMNISNAQGWTPLKIVEKKKVADVAAVLHQVQQQRAEKDAIAKAQPDTAPEEKMQPISTSETKAIRPTQASEEKTVSSDVQPAAIPASEKIQKNAENIEETIPTADIARMYAILEQAKSSVLEAKAFQEQAEMRNQELEEQLKQMQEQNTVLTERLNEYEKAAKTVQEAEKAAQDTKKAELNAEKEAANKAAKEAEEKIKEAEKAKAIAKEAAEKAKEAANKAAKEAEEKIKEAEKAKAIAKEAAEKAEKLAKQASEKTTDKTVKKTEVNVQDKVKTNVIKSKAESKKKTPQPIVKKPIYKPQLSNLDKNIYAGDEEIVYCLSYLGNGENSNMRQASGFFAAAAGITEARYQQIVRISDAFFASSDAVTLQKRSDECAKIITPTDKNKQNKIIRSLNSSIK